MAIDIDNIIREWWDSYQADPRASYDNIKSGLKAPQYTEAGEITYPGGVKQSINKSQLQTGACQYWIKGLPAVCSNWDIEKLQCKLSPEQSPDVPTGYGVGKCDMLGRREWCSHYVKSKEHDYSEYVCVVTCPEKSGVGKQVKTNKSFVELRPVLPSEVQGYNQDEFGVGKCDGWGLGRGNQKDIFNNVEELYQYGPICKYYRPQQMGFGAIPPRPFHGSTEAGRPFDASKNFLPKTDLELYDGSEADPLRAINKRIPFVFQVYNARAMYQKCAHWDNNRPSFFRMSSESDVSMQAIYLDDSVYCSCNDSACDPYKTIKEYWPTGIPWIVSEVIAEYGGVICNGAKPECPCYTGNWVYCNDNNMRDGMRITADQILELRFWTSSWGSQEEYDTYYLQKPGRSFNGNNDESTSSIYTFTKWEKLNPLDPNESVMIGYKHSMCMPAPLHMREFDPELYITKAFVRYPKINTNTGTNSPGQVSFPTLVRELENIDFYVPDINIIYPYSTINPWDTQVCSNEDKPEYCVHDTNLMSNPFISVIGQTAQDCEMYIINLSLIEDNHELRKVSEYIEKYERASQINNNSIRHDYNYKVSKLIEECFKRNSGFIKGESNENGLFIINNVELKANSINKLYILCKYNSEPLPEYSFRKVRVLSRYWGALITQNSMTHTHFNGAASNGYPKRFTPGATINASVSTNIGTVDSVIPIYKYINVGLFGTKTYIGYCINEYEDTVEEVEHWVRVGSTGYIWAEIDDINISYLWPMRVVSAELRPILKEDGTPVRKLNLCGYDEPDYKKVSIKLKSVDISRKNIPPNAVLLKADKPIGAFNNSWKLKITYKYSLLETRKVNPTWPTGMDAKNGSIFFRNSQFNVKHVKSANTFVIENVGSTTTKATMSVMAFISDNNGRIQTAAATKLLVQGYRQGNRNVEIEYIYSAAIAKSYKLVPEGGFATWRGAPKAMDNDKAGFHYMRAYCGDHSCQSNNCIGPLWYPFDDCTPEAFYNFYTPAAQCFAYMTEGKDEVKKMGVGAWRYGVAPEYNCWVTEGGNWASTCGASWRYYYSRADISSMQFVGTAKVRANIGTPQSYAFMEWTPPPFGFNSRAFIERFISEDFVGFVNFSAAIPYSDSSYLPAVFNLNDLINTNMDCFNGKVYSGGEISFFPMLSNYLASFVGESMSKQRYRFDEILNPILHLECSYPGPLVALGELYYAIRYGFKSDNIVWAWPELWKPIDRDIDKKCKFYFVELKLPNYIIDYIKMEHRLVTDEGTNTITFFPPEGEPDSGMTVYPSIALGSGKKRYFDIIYSNYDTSNNVAWKDESSEGKVGGSDGNNIYELANNGIANPPTAVRWMHDFDTIFDHEAESEANDSRMILLGQDDETKEKKFGHFNRGVIVKLPINRLKYLPMDIFDAGNPALTSEKVEELLYYWEIEGNFGIAPVQVEIEGYYGIGRDPDGKACSFDRPAVFVAESEDKPVFSVPSIPEWVETAEVVGATEGIDGRTLYGIKNFELVVDIERTPIRFVRNLSYFMVKIQASPGARLNIRKLKVSVGKYKKAVENIRLWERKFLIGEISSVYSNADGVRSSVLRTSDKDKANSGQFFPANGLTKYGTTVLGYSRMNAHGGSMGGFVVAPVEYNGSEDQIFDAGRAISKVCITSYDEFSKEDEDIDISIDNLKEVERDAQADEFRKATKLENYDNMQFSPIMHPIISTWMHNINSNLPIHTAMSLQYNRIKWEDSGYSKALGQEGDFWQPGGHYFAWSDRVLRTKCYILGPVQTVYEPKFVHHKHGGGSEEVMDAGHAYAGYGRIQYANAKIAVTQALGLDESNATVDLLTQARNGLMGG